MFEIGTAGDEAAGNWSSVFLGKYYRDELGYTQPFYTNGSTPTAPSGYQLIEATTFTVADNPSYNGRYTVYTKISAADPYASSIFGAGKTTIRVNEQVGAPLSGGDTSVGYITNVSTYYIIYPSNTGPMALVIPPGVSTNNDYAIELVGRNFSGWGEVLQTTLVRLGTNFAGPTSPTGIAIGALWYNSTLNQMHVWNGSTWAVLNSSSFAPVDSVRVPFTAVANSPVAVIHGLGIPASPFICHHSFFIDSGGGVYKPILPADVTYVNANRFDVTFSTNYAGIALVRR